MDGNMKIDDDAIRLIMGGKFYRWDQGRCLENLIYGISGVFVLMLVLFVVFVR